MPPIEPPTTAAHRPMPRASASAASAATWSRTVRYGNRDPQGRPSGPGEEGPVLPWQPPSTFGATTNHRSVSSARPGPTSASHQPGVGWPGPAGPAAWLSPVRACRTRTALEESAARCPQVSYARRTPGSRTPDSRGSGSSIVTQWRRPGGSPSLRPPEAGGRGGAAGEALRFRTPPSRPGTLPPGRPSGRPRSPGRPRAAPGPAWHRWRSAAPRSAGCAWWRPGG